MQKRSQIQPTTCGGSSFLLGIMPKALSVFL
jgi:hypothetical protein